jgi:hypothetical protein
LNNYAASPKVRLRPLRAIKYILTLTLLLRLITLPSTLYAQDSPITVSLNNTHYTTDELVILTVSVVDASPQQPRPILPPLDGLAVVDFDIATNVSAVQGEIFTEVIYTYELQPRRTGSLIIPSIPVKIDGKIYRSAPISIMVTQGSAPAPSPGNAVAPLDIVPPADLEGQDFFVEAVVDLAQPYIGQQLIYIFRFYQALQLYRQPQSEMPIFNGFETIGLPVQQYNLDIAGRTYLISEIRTALFPKTSGAIKIGPARLMFPGNFFEEPVELYTEPITVQVKPLLDNPPPGFNGAVGQYAIKAWFSPQVAVINQPATYSVAISGSGNIYALPQPIWPPLHEWRTYDSLTSQTTDMKDGLMTGTRVFERLMISDQLGDLTIPPTLFVYFDPIASAYRTISTEPLSVRVIPAPTPNPAAATANAIIAASTAASVAAIDTVGTPVPPDNSLVNPLLPDSPNPNWRAALPFGLILILAVCGTMPIAAAMGAGGVWLWQKRQQQLLMNAETLKSPRQKMHRTLLAHMAKSDDNYKVVAEALHSYLSELLRLPTKGLTRTELAGRLQKRGLDRAYIARIGECLAQSDMGRYAPREKVDAGWDLLVETDALLFKLDEIFHPQPKAPAR